MDMAFRSVKNILLTFFFPFDISSFFQVTSKPILIYPNSGESYDGDHKEWVVSSDSEVC